MMQWRVAFCRCLHLYSFHVRSFLTGRKYLTLTCSQQVFKLAIVYKVYNVVPSVAALREMWLNVLISSRYTSLRIYVRWEDVKSAIFLKHYEYWNSYVLSNFDFISQFCLFIIQGTSERISEFHDACLRWCDDCCYSLVRYVSQVTNCDVDSIFQHNVLCKSCFWGLDCLVANLKTEIWRWPVL